MTYQLPTKHRRARLAPAVPSSPYRSIAPAAKAPMAIVLLASAALLTPSQAAASPAPPCPSALAIPAR